MSYRIIIECAAWAARNHKEARETAQRLLAEIERVIDVGELSLVMVESVTVKRVESE